MGDLARWATAVRPAARAVHPRLSAYRRRLPGCGATRLQGGRRHRGLSEGTTRSLPARRPDHEPACGRDATNLRDDGSPAARSRTAPLALLADPLGPARSLRRHRIQWPGAIAAHADAVPRQSPMMRRTE